MSEISSTTPDRGTEVEAIRAEIDSLNDRAWSVRNSDPSLAMEMGVRAFELSQAIDYCRGTAMSERNIGLCHISRSETALAHPRIERALRLSRKLDDKVLEGSCLASIGLAHYHDGRFPEAMEHYNQALDLQQETGDTRGETATLNNIGLIYHYLKNYQSCIDYYLRSLEAIKTMDCPVRGTVLSNIGRVYWDLEDWASAMKYHRESLQIAQASGNKSLEAMALCNLGVTLYRNDRPDEALDRLFESLNLSTSLGKKFDQMEALHYIGLTFDQLGNSDQAVSYLDEALEIVQDDPGDVNETPRICHSLGVVHFHRGDKTTARRFLERSVSLAERSDLKHVVSACHKILAEISESSGDASLALQHFKKHHRLEAEQYREETQRRSTAIMIQMEVEKAQNEAEIHRLRYQELAKTHDTLIVADLEQVELLKKLQQQTKTMHAQALELERQTMEDALTKLYNRRFIEDWLARHLENVSRYGGTLTVAIIDIDYFKQINDTFSHQAGDRVLKALAQIMQKRCRSSDVPARYGGEEFVIAFPHTDVEHALIVCEDIRMLVETEAWDIIHPDLRVTISVGVSDDTSTGNHERMLSIADTCLYHAKRSGRNQCVSDREMRKDAA